MRSTRWFNQGADAIATLWPDGPRCYVCPLCMRPLMQPDETTKEDVPPQTLGGRPLILTCRKCNNNAGARLDHEMHKLEQTYDFALGTLTHPMRSKLTIGGQTLNVETLATEGGIQILGLPNNNSPDAQDVMMAELERMTQPGGWEASELKISNIGYRHQNAVVGWLRAAYLGAFALFGYRYVTQPQCAVVRKQILEPSKRILKGFILTNLKMSPSEKQIILIREPSWLEGFLAVRLGRHIVFLPGIKKKSNVYRRLATHSKSNSDLSVSGDAWAWPRGPQFALDLQPRSQAS